MIDIHSHILHEVDDGSENIDESINIIKRAKRHGIEAMFATPHYLSNGFESDVKNNSDKLDEIKKRLVKENIDMNIYIGNEIFLDYEILDYLEENKATSLNGSRYVLIELPMMQVPNYLENSVFNMKINGMIPIIAHPERYAYIQRDLGVIERWVELGALMQLNLSSLTGRYGEEVNKVAIKMLERDMYHFVGSDVHKFNSKSLSVENTLEQVKAIVGNKRYEEIVNINGQKIISNEIIEAHEIKGEKKSFLKKIISFIG